MDVNARIASVLATLLAAGGASGCASSTYDGSATTPVEVATEQNMPATQEQLEIMRSMGMAEAADIAEKDGLTAQQQIDIAQVEQLLDHLRTKYALDFEASDFARAEMMDGRWRLWAEVPNGAYSGIETCCVWEDGVYTDDFVSQVRHADIEDEVYAIVGQMYDVKSESCLCQVVADSKQLGDDVALNTDAKELVRLVPSQIWIYLGPDTDIEEEQYRSKADELHAELIDRDITCSYSVYHILNPVGNGAFSWETINDTVMQGKDGVNYEWHIYDVASAPLDGEVR